MSQCLLDNLLACGSLFGDDLLECLVVYAITNFGSGIYKLSVSSLSI
jgi:hypothetical protein